MIGDVETTPDSPDQAGSAGGSAGQNAAGSQTAGQQGGRTGATGGNAGAGGSIGIGGAAGTGGEGATGGNVVIPPAGRGATLPWIEYEAEDQPDKTGTVIGPSRDFGDPAAEASGRRAVKLAEAGQYVHVTNQRQANGIVVRYSVPDQGASWWGTLSVYVNGSLRARLDVTSRYSWTYGGFPNGSPNDPGQQSPHHFYDEAHALIGDVPAGATVSVQKDGSDTAGYYIIDLIDLEQVPAPLPKPSGYMSITDCGATPDDNTDDQAAIQTCIDQAIGGHRGLYIPEGTFKVIAKPLSVNNVTIRGAGMWYSTISGYNARFDCWSDGCKYYDLAVFGDTILRDDKAPDSCFSGKTGSGSWVENVWMEHSKTGYWVGPNANGLTIRGCRIRNLYADGVNFWKGTSNSVVEQTHLRNTGDDALAMWSDATNGNGPDTGNVFRFNTIQVPWMANCIGVYGGTDNRVEDSVCMDVVQYPGILIAQQFGSNSFQGSTQILRTSLIRAGGYAYSQEQGALKFQAAQGDMNGLLVEDVAIQDASYSGIHFQGGNAINNLAFKNVAVSGAGRAGIQVNDDAHGNASANGLVVTGGGMQDDSNGAFGWTRGTGNSGW
jgi:hypothetical protein